MRVLQKSSNPAFLKTVCFWPSDGLSGESCIRVMAYDVREKFSGLATPLGSAKFYLSTLLECQPSRFRVQLLSSSNVVAGFLTLTIWRHERENAANTSTESTPCRSLHHTNSLNVSIYEVCPVSFATTLRKHSTSSAISMKFRGKFVNKPSSLRMLSFKSNHSQ